jgi:transcriptional regulator with XRE-family HTH domain
MATKGAGETFKQLRKQAGLSQKEAADKLGLSSNSLYFWESDRTFPKPELWDRLIDMYQLDRAKLIRMAGGEASPRVRRYLNQHQEQQSGSIKQNERRGKRIYLRSKARGKQPVEPKTEIPQEQHAEQARLQQRITDLEHKVAKMESSMPILERAEELVRAWDRFKKALKAG